MVSGAKQRVLLQQRPDLTLEAAWNCVAVFIKPKIEFPENLNQVLWVRVTAIFGFLIGVE